MHRMINLLCAFHPYDHLIRLIQEFFLDLARKQEVFQSWNGCSFLQCPQWTLMADFKVSSDTSGALGYGAVFQGHRFSGAWLAKHLNRSLSPSSTRTSSLLSWQPSSAPPPPYGPSNGSTSYPTLSVVEILRSDTSRAPAVMSWFAICPY